MNEKAIKEYLEFQVNYNSSFKTSYMVIFEIITTLVCFLAYIENFRLCAVITMIVNIISVIFTIKSMRKKESNRAYMLAFAIMGTDVAFMSAVITCLFLCEIHPVSTLYYFGMIGIYLVCSLLGILAVSRQANKEGKFKGKRIKVSPAYGTIGYSVGVLIEVLNIGKETDYEVNMMIGAAASFAFIVICSIGSGYYYIYYLMKKYDMYS